MERKFGFTCQCGCYWEVSDNSGHAVCPTCKISLRSSLKSGMAENGSIRSVWGILNSIRASLERALCLEV